MRVSGPTLDAADPLALADFYERLLGWPIIRREGPGPDGPPNDGWAILRRPDGGLKLEIQYGPNYVRPVWPGDGGAQLQMMHLDIGVADLDSAVAWAKEQGAGMAAHQPHNPPKNPAGDKASFGFPAWIDPRNVARCFERGDLVLSGPPDAILREVLHELVEVAALQRGAAVVDGDLVSTHGGLGRAARLTILCEAGRRKTGEHSKDCESLHH